MRQLTIPINGDDHVIGNPNGTLELIEYGDYECPHCGRAYRIVNNILGQLEADIKFVFRNFPLQNIHPHAFSASLATEAAGLQGKLWEMHDIIFENQNALEDEKIYLFADRLGLHIE